MANRSVTSHIAPDVRQRKELTFKHNSAHGRHGWLRLTPAYSVKIVDEILRNRQRHLTVLDPFSGTGTTVLCAAMREQPAVGLDINPFLVWLGRVKVQRYSHDVIVNVEELAGRVLQYVQDKDSVLAEQPPIHNIERWWEAGNLSTLRRLKAGIDYVSREKEAVRNLLLVAFCRTMMAVSNAAFNHQSMSFRTTPSASGQRLLFMREEDEIVAIRFKDDVDLVLAGAKENPTITATVLLADSRIIPTVFDEGIDLVITSPPYPNRMSYVRELRPYMYWLGFLTKARQAGELDWSAIGGTWGIATSRVTNWRKHPETYFPEYLDNVLDRIRLSGMKSAEVLSKYVGRYFEDIWAHLGSISRVLNPGAEVHYIVGNSKFHEVVVPTEMIYRDMLDHLGFTQLSIIPLRKRNSKKELFESDVVGVFRN